MKDGIIDLDSDRGKEFGFTSDKFDGWLWKKGKNIWISFIISKQQGKGNFRDLLQHIRILGYGVKVPTPSTRMAAILRKLGFTYTWTKTTMFGCIKESCEVWEIKRL